jgi:2-keto-4-pentenoate hydratase/2-oxohepta-3-ene-1,7-dioic acid hydratase in catechol pathway
MVRFGEEGREKAGLLDSAGAVRDASAFVADISAATLADGALAKLRDLDPQSLPLAPVGVRLGACVAESRNFIAIGTNYSDAVKPGAEPPAEPVVFNKAPSCVVGPNDDVIIPEGSSRTEWEVELAIVIGARAWRVSPENAVDHIAGYCLCNDLSEREYQFDRGGTWTKGKGFPTFGPLGPWLATPDEVEFGTIDLWLSLNDEPMQAGSTRTMIFPPAEIVSYLSRIMILQPGDVITSGTPPAVGDRPKIYLKPGDVMTLGATGLGTQRQVARAFS